MSTLAQEADSLTYDSDLASLVVAFHERVHGGSARWCDEPMCSTAWECKSLWEQLVNGAK